jgi:dienelactone hydrolase
MDRAGHLAAESDAPDRLICIKVIRRLPAYIETIGGTGAVQGRMVPRKFLFLAAALMLLATDGRAQVAVDFPASDGVIVYGDSYSPSPSGEVRGTVLLFHQSMSNRGEYATVGERFAQAGYFALAIDQRAGGYRWGLTNQTMQGIGPEASDRILREGRYAGVLSDLEAALDYAAKRPARPIIVIGSGYSAGLVFLLAARHPELVGAVLAFSPAEYFYGISVRDAASRVRCPVFVTAENNAGAIDEARKILDAVPAAIRVMFRPRHATKGATMLRRDINPHGGAENWTAVMEFLDLLKGHEDEINASVDDVPSH